MLPTEDDVRQITETVWELMLHTQAQLSAPMLASEVVTSSVDVTGAFNGRITLTCDRTLAHSAAAIMFGRTDVAPAELMDAVGELCNMIGGNVRSLLPEPCQLSLPHTRPQPAATEPQARPLIELSFSAGGQPFMVRMSEKA